MSLDDAGLATAWNPAPDGQVLTILVDAAGLQTAGAARVFVGGSFANAFGAGHVHLFRATMTGAGTADAWAPAPNAAVNDMALVGPLLYVVGAFTVIGSGVDVMRGPRRWAARESPA